MAYYIFIHMGQQGLVFVFLPALMLLSAAAIPPAWQERRSLRTGLAVLMGLSASIFLFGPTYPLEGSGLKLLTAQTLEEHSTYYQKRLEAVNFSDYSPASTLIVSSGWRFPQYYLPDYQYLPFTLGARWEVSEGKPTIDGDLLVDLGDLGVQPDNTGRIALVIFDPDLLPYVDPNGRDLHEVSGVDGLSVVSLYPGDQLRLSQEGIRVEGP